MAVQAATGTFTIASTDAVNTTQAITIGFTPKAIIFWLCGNTGTTDTITNATARYGFGVATSTTDRRALGSISVHASAAIDGGRILRSDACIAIPLNTNAVDGLLDINSFDANGFTVIVDDQFSTTIRVSYFAIGGAGITNASTGTFTCPITTGNFDITSLAFQPDFVCMFSNGLTTDANTTSASRGYLTVGAAISSSARGVVAIGEGPENNVTSQSKSYAYDGEVFANLSDTPTTMGTRADFVSFLSNGFRLNFLEATSGNTYRVPFLAIKGGNWSVGNLLTQTDTTTAIAKSSFGFTPAGGMLLSHQQAKSTQDTVQANGRLSIGAFTSASSRVVQALLQEDGLADTDVTQAIEHDEVYINIATDSTVQGLMDIQSVDGDGFTAIMDDADPSQAFVWYFAVGQANTGTSSATLSTLTVSSAGNVPIVGTSAPTLGTLTVSAAGNVPRTGTGSATLDALTVSAAGNVVSNNIGGTSSITLDALTVSAAGNVPIVGTATGTLAALTVSGAGNVPIVGTATDTLDALTVSAAGNVPIVGTSSITLDAVTVSAAGNVPIVGTASVTLGTLTVSAAGSVSAIEGTIDTRQKRLSVLNLAVPIRLLPDPSGGIGARQRRILAYLYAFASSGVSGAAAITLSSLSVAGGGIVAIQGSATLALDDVTALAAGSVADVLHGTAAIELDSLALSTLATSVILEILISGSIYGASNASTVTGAQASGIVLGANANGSS